MSLIESCKNGDLEGVKTALQSGDDVNTKDEDGWTGLMWAVSLNHNSVVDLLLKKPNIDVNLKSESSGFCALHCAVFSQNSDGLKMLLNVPNINVNIMDNQGWSALDMTFVPFLPGKHFAGKCRNKNKEALKLLLNVPTIDVNTVDDRGENALHWALDTDSFEGLKLLLHHPNLTALTLNQKDKWFGNTPAMQAVKQNTLKYLEVLVADPRVDLDTTDKEGKSLEKAARDRGEGRGKVVAEAKQRREERRRLNRLIREQQRQVSKVLLDGLYDPDSPFSKLNGVRTEVVGEIIWQKLVENWQIFPEDLLSSVLLSARKINCKVQ